MILRVFVVEAFRLASGSMQPTLEVGDRILVNKRDAVPRRGAVVVFRYPENPSTNFASRVVAMAGDELEVLDGRAVVNGVVAPQCYVGPYTTSRGVGELYLEKLDGVVYGVLHNAKFDEERCRTSSDCRVGACRHEICALVVEGPYKVKPGEFWVLGDNRDNSHDSRRWNGGIGAGAPVDHEIGSASYLLASMVAGRRQKRVQGLPNLGSANTLLAPAVEKCANALSTGP